MNSALPLSWASCIRVDAAGTALRRGSRADTRPAASFSRLYVVSRARQRAGPLPPRVRPAANPARIPSVHPGDLCAAPSALRHRDLLTVQKGGRCRSHFRTRHRLGCRRGRLRVLRHIPDPTRACGPDAQGSGIHERPRRGPVDAARGRTSVAEDADTPAGTGVGERSTLLDLADPGPGTLASRPDRRSTARLGLVRTWSEGRGIDSLVHACSAIAMIEATAGRRSHVLPAQALDHGTGHLLAAAVLRALGDRHATGGGQHLRLSLAGTASCCTHCPRSVIRRARKLEPWTERVGYRSAEPGLSGAAEPDRPGRFWTITRYSPAPAGPGNSIARRQRRSRSGSAGSPHHPDAPCHNRRGERRRGLKRGRDGGRRTPCSGRRGARADRSRGSRDAAGSGSR
ncbi:CoA transferase [Streptomyces sp. SAI-129]|uniref:CoA transferase n=1 Tax=Streptomyces sp. SAI-129 TaxID=3377727 RepID=UPI003C7D95A1